MTRRERPISGPLLLPRIVVSYGELMTALNIAASIVALLISAGEIARFGGSERFIPMALDEILIAIALFLAAYRAPRDGACWHLAAWGGLCGLVLVVLVEILDHQMHGPAKAAGSLYLTALSALLITGLWAVGRALRLVRSGARR